LSKISHFVHFNGVISCFLDDQQAIDDLSKSTKDIIHSDEVSPDNVISGNKNLCNNFDDITFGMTKTSIDDDESIGYAESVFREIHGVPNSYDYIPNARARIHLNLHHFLRQPHGDLPV